MAQLEIFCQVPSLTPGSTIRINLLMAEVNESGEPTFRLAVRSSGMIQTMVAHSELLGHLQPLIFNDIRFMQGFPFLAGSTIEITSSLCGWVGTSFDQHIGQVLSQFSPPSNIEYIYIKGNRPNTNLYIYIFFRVRGMGRMGLGLFDIVAVLFL